MIFTSKGKSYNKNVSNIIIYGRNVEQVNKTKFLGIVIGEHLNWATHISHLCTIIARNVSFHSSKVTIIISPKAGFILRTQIYGAYADHFAHLGRVFSATNADLRRKDRSGAECKHSYNTPSFTRGCWIVIG